MRSACVGVLTVALLLSPNAPLATAEEQTAVEAATSAVAPRLHDWRSPGFPAVVSGRLYDAACSPLASVGSNVPNLPFRPGAVQTLEWARAANMRWIRVFATGHGIANDRAPRDSAAAIRRLRDLLDQAQAFNNAHPPEQSVYVLVSLTDYYPRGVPGDRHAYDAEGFRDAPVLPAPWYRAGTRRFDFDQEHDLGVLSDLPNYEVFYKPWVIDIVSSLAGSRALLGWQLGNELKARSSPRNDITPAQAYDWYLDFTRDMVDTIRTYDQNHLVFTGAQHVAQLVDWNYRDGDGALRPELLPTYAALVRQAADACGAHCWNVWGLTGYDASPFPLDDAAMFGRVGIASVYTEFGFTLEARGDSQQRFSADRSAAVRGGAPFAWVDIDGTQWPRAWSVSELAQRAGIAGIAPWGSPAPTAGAAMDADTGRGITFATDAEPLWAAWREAGAMLEAANRAAGPSAECRALDSRVRDSPGMAAR
ncbi:MAG: Sugar-binding cellulase-like protein [Chloroflexi bacterium]|nr:Sugar-binding cellulase-like protein [Chloroflexota bacterium]